MIAIIFPCSYITVENVKSILVLRSSNNGLNRSKNFIHCSWFAQPLAISQIIMEVARGAGCR